METQEKVQGNIKSNPYSKPNKITLKHKSTCYKHLLISSFNTNTHQNLNLLTKELGKKRKEKKRHIFKVIKVGKREKSWELRLRVLYRLMIAKWLFQSLFISSSCFMLVFAYTCEHSKL